MTTWKPIEGFSLYEVNEYGQVRSWRQMERKWRKPFRSARRDTPVILQGTVTPLGYIAFILRSDENKIVRKTAHRLVGEAFLGEPPSPFHTDIAHNDGNPANNHISNLRWATHRDNQMDMRLHGTMQDGEKSCTAKLTESQVRDILEQHKNGKRGIGVILARKYGVRTSQISRIASGKRWAYLH